jgi:hypothetical protein
MEGMAVLQQLQCHNESKHDHGHADYSDADLSSGNEKVDIIRTPESIVSDGSSISCEDSSDVGYDWDISELEAFFSSSYIPKKRVYCKDMNVFEQVEDVERIEDSNESDYSDEDIEMGDTSIVKVTDDNVMDDSDKDTSTSIKVLQVDKTVDTSNEVAVVHMSEEEDDDEYIRDEVMSTENSSDDELALMESQLLTNLLDFEG